MSFVQRRIEVSIKLASNPQTNQPNTFAESGSDTITLSGHRTSVQIQNSGAPAGSEAHVKIFGLTPSIMNQLATLGMVFNIIPRNTLTVSAGDEEGGTTPVFSGTILNAYANYNNAPNVPFELVCQSGLADAVAPAAPSSFTGSTDVATIMSGFARQMNLGFENNGVNAKLSNPYFAGNLWTQMRAAAEHANINAEVINGTVLAIWPKGGSRDTQTPPLVSPQTGMIGYPIFTPQGIIVKSLFNPLINFGGLVRVQSSIKAVTDVGSWAINKLDHMLEALVPHGEWMSTLYCYNPKYPQPVPSRT